MQQPSMTPRQIQNLKKKIADMPVSSYEEDLIWMSYRYCIGRHTIAACSHAHDIAKNHYRRLSDSQAEMMARDIRNEIKQSLQIGSYNVRFSDALCPLEKSLGYGSGSAIVYEYLIHVLATDKDIDLGRIKRLSIDVDENNDIFWKVEKLEDENKAMSMHHTSLSGLVMDFHPWAMLAACMDRSNHHFRVDPSSYVQYEYFETVDPFTGKRILVDVDEYLENPNCRYYDPMILNDSI